MTFIDSLKEERRERVMSLLDPERREEVRELINYPEGTVGRIMNTDFLALAAGMVIGGAAFLWRGNPILGLWPGCRAR